MIEAFAAWLGRTPLSAFVANAAWVVPTVQTVHILAISVVMGAAVIVNLRVLGLVERRQSIGALAARFTAPSAAAMVVLLITGLLMIAGEPNRALFRYIFWIKMALVLLALGVTTGLLAGLKAGEAYDAPGRAAPIPYRLLAAAGLAIWVAVIVSGRWIGYAEGWPGSPN